jgi:hypothetical protein
MGIIRIRPASALPCAGPYSINAHALGRYSMPPLEMTLHIEEEITIPQCKCKWKGGVFYEMTATLGNVKVVKHRMLNLKTKKIVTHQPSN